LLTAAPGEVKRKSQFGRSSEFSLKIVEEDISNLMATIRSPSGAEEPCLLKRLANGHLGMYQCTRWWLLFCFVLLGFCFADIFFFYLYKNLNHVNL
jgi:hypothetical protein